MRHKSEVLRTLVLVCDSLHRLQAEPVARQACTEVAGFLCEELKKLQRHLDEVHD